MINDLPTVPDLMKLGVAKSYAYQIAKGDRTPGPDLALRIYRTLGHKIGPIQNATESDISALEALMAKGVVA